MSYGWDYDGDGTIDQTTTTPQVEHTYPSSTTSVTPGVFVEDSVGWYGFRFGGVIARGSRNQRLRTEPDDHTQDPAGCDFGLRAFRRCRFRGRRGGFLDVDGRQLAAADHDGPDTRRSRSPTRASTRSRSRRAPRPRPRSTRRSTVLNSGPPHAEDDDATVMRDLPRPIAVMDNDSDPDAGLDPSTVSVTSAPDHGSTVVSPATGRVRYSPEAGYTGLDSFVYEVCDSDALCASATVHIMVEAPSGPTAVDDSFTATQGAVLTTGAPGVLANDTAPTPGDVLEAGIAWPAAHGLVELSPNGAVKYTPDAGYVGPDRFRYVVFDALEHSSHWATATINVRPAPPAPHLGIGNAAVVEGNAGQRSLRFTVSLSNATTRAVSVKYVTKAGSAAAGSDFVTKSGTATIPQGSTSTIVTIAVKGDTTTEPNETFTVKLSAPIGAVITRRERDGHHPQ